MNAKPELLAPAGSFACLKAALAGGADAVYLGSNELNARLRAPNFAPDALAGAVELARRASAKVYLTANTLLFDEDLPRAALLLDAAVEAGVDAVIVQDLGLARLLRARHPTLALHASTQMTVHNARQAATLAKAGFSRFILARELSLPEIAGVTAAAKEAGAGTEVFVHGALCVSYSGQCLASAFLEGRSGNRGVCAQCCRQRYRLEKAGKVLADGNLLSLRDLCALPSLPALAEAGVSALKIEGRLKRPEYVAGVTSAYREALDRLAAGNPGPWPDLQSRLDELFNRGFTGGGMTGPLSSADRTSGDAGPLHPRLGFVEDVDVERSRLVVRLERKLSDGDGFYVAPSEGGPPAAFIVSKVFDPMPDGATPVGVRARGVLSHELKGGEAFLSGPAEAFQRERERVERWHPPGIPLDIVLEGAAGKPMSVRASGPDGVVGEARSALPLQEARRHPMSAYSLAGTLGRFGGTRYRAGRFLLPEGASWFLPTSELNDLRRRLLGSLEYQRERPRKVLAPWQPTAAEPHPSRRTLLLAVVSDPETARLAAAAGVARVAMDRHWETPPTIGRAERWLATGPIGRGDSSERLSEWLGKHRGECAGVLCGDAGALSAARAAGVPAWAGPSFNLANGEAARAAQALGFAGGIVSWEVSPAAAGAIAAAMEWPIGFPVFGHVPLFATALSDLDRGDKPAREAGQFLVDEAGRRLPLDPFEMGGNAGSGTMVLSAEPIDRLSEAPNVLESLLGRVASFVLDLRHLAPQAAAKIVTAYSGKRPDTKDPRGRPGRP